MGNRLYEAAQCNGSRSSSSTLLASLGSAWSSDSTLSAAAVGQTRIPSSSYLRPTHSGPLYTPHVSQIWLLVRRHPSRLCLVSGTRVGETLMDRLGGGDDATTLSQVEMQVRSGGARVT
jgi:hypothetical protein